MNKFFLSFFFVSSLFSMDGKDWMLRKISESVAQDGQSAQVRQINRLEKELLPKLVQKTQTPFPILLQYEDVKSFMRFVYENPFQEKEADTKFNQLCKNILNEKLLISLKSFTGFPQNDLLEYQVIIGYQRFSIRELIDDIDSNDYDVWTQNLNKLCQHIEHREFGYILRILRSSGVIGLKLDPSDPLHIRKKKIIKKVLIQNTGIIGTIEFADTDTDEEKERKKLIFYCARQFCNEQMKIDDDMITDVTNFNNYLRLGLKFSLGGLLTWVGVKALLEAYHEPESICVHGVFGTLFSLVGLRGLKTGAVEAFNSYKTYKTAQRYKNVYKLLSQHARDQLNEINSEILEERKTEACCPICLEALGDENVYQTLCDHYFHQACLSKYSGNTCPICRRINYK